MDQRTDIWAFGGVLYETLTGHLPFGGYYAQAVLYSIQHEEPKLPDVIPANLQQILHKSLAKDLSERYQHMDELLNDLIETKETTNLKTTPEVLQKALFSKSHFYLSASVLLILLMVSGLVYILNRIQPIDSIAVLPFNNSDKGPDIEYLSDGLTETLINKLSLLPKLRVMARSTVFRYKRKDVTPQQVGNETVEKYNLSLRGMITTKQSALFAHGFGDYFVTSFLVMTRKYFFESLSNIS